MAMKRKISLLFLAGGFFFITVAGIQIYSSKKIQSETLEKATQLLKAEQPVSFEKVPPSQNEDVIGILNLQPLAEKFPIVAGTTDEDLEKGVGHYDGTALPDEKDQIVLSGHRDTVFKRLGELKLGDELTVEMPYGTFTYVIEKTFIVEADDRTVIRSTAPNEVLTLTTCYPFNFVGDAPQRYIVNAKRKP